MWVEPYTVLESVKAGALHGESQLVARAAAVFGYVKNYYSPAFIPAFFLLQIQKCFPLPVLQVPLAAGSEPGESTSTLNFKLDEALQRQLS